MRRTVRPADDFKKALAEINQKLKDGRTRVKVERRGDRLSLVACLPNKQGQDKRTRRISPGLPANAIGLREIHRLALQLAGELAGKCFDWHNWCEQSEEEPTAKTCAQWIEGYRRYLNHSGALKGDEQQRDRQWRRNYWNPALKWLPQDKTLDESALVIAALHHDAVDEKGKPRRSRQLACIRLEQFAKWAELDVRLKPYRGKYSPRQVDRSIPSDEVIESAMQAIANPDWKWAAGMMATFGLRDHECWFVSLQQDADGWLAVVSDGKTGGRSVRPLHPHWVELFDLSNGKAPDIQVRSHDEYGERMARQFKRCNIPFTPYELRHAYAIRSSVVYKIPVPVSAAHMGHSPEVHSRIYNKHLSEEAKAAAYWKAVKADRPSMKRSGD